MTLARLKLIALISMTLDHTIKLLPMQKMLLTLFGMDYSDSYILLNLILPLGRIAFPIFVFSIIEGCTYTHNKRKYLMRLLIFALCSELPFQLAISDSPPHIAFTNVIFTLLLGASACMIYDYFKEKGKSLIAVFPIVILILLAEVCEMDYGAYGVILIILPYIVKNKNLRIAALAVGITIYSLLYVPYNGTTFLWMNSYIFDWLFTLIAVVLIYFSNGQKGKSFKWGFYIYYPLHLFLIFVFGSIITFIP